MWMKCKKITKQGKDKITKQGKLQLSLFFHKQNKFLGRWQYKNLIIKLSRENIMHSKNSENKQNKIAAINGNGGEK